MMCVFLRRILFRELRLRLIKINLYEDYGLNLQELEDSKSHEVT